MLDVLSFESGESDSLQRPVDDVVGQLSIDRSGPVALDEVLVAVARMELDRLDRATADREVLGERSCVERRLARARRAVEDDLLLVVDQPIGARAS